MAYLQKAETKNAPKRSGKDYLTSSRSELVNHFKTEVTKKPGHSIGQFLKKYFWSWIYHYLKSRFGKKFPYAGYVHPDTGMYDMDANHPADKPIRICIASDWATDTDDSFTIAGQIKQEDPDFTIHVGDTYYVGAPHEIHSNFVDEGSPWYRGKAGSFCVLGNHEMYAKGDAFFECLLPTLGLRNQQGLYTGQKAGYFCLQNRYWRILGLDTGYHSTGIPLLEFLPWFEPQCQLDDRLMQWLKDIVKIGDPTDKRGLLFLTHHQYISAFKKEHEYLKPAAQLASLLGKEKKVLWLWGHEHKLSFFGKVQVKDGITAFGRCIGNGGTPVEVNGKSFQPDRAKNGFSRLVAVDRRPQKTIQHTTIGYNSYATLVLQDDELTISYADNTAYLLSEKWKANITSGEISGEMIVPASCPLACEAGKVWSDAAR